MDREIVRFVIAVALFLLIPLAIYSLIGR